ncbi:MAG TPA: exodeoxyribonuclease V subunit alpha [Propionicimonas sp.]|nr:exodeoxyribonuclease V subunit alpha [Propionicimonas sp.]HRA05006.1 exodeoxyribonuclease V subunit alpha [Propionicimonas sp.]
MTDLASSLRPGLLLDVHATGALSWGDVHVAQKVAHLYGEPEQSVQLALALAVRALRAGSTCLDLSATEQTVSGVDEDAVGVPPELLPRAELWRQAITVSPLVNVGVEPAGDRPLRLVGDLLYLERYWQEETEVADEIRRRRACLPAPIEPSRLAAAAAELLAGDTDTDQAVAAIMPTLTAVTVIGGGPGTGKTHTLARLLGTLWQTLPKAPLVALAAPTGKAAVRMQEALAAELDTLPAEVADEIGRLRATTIHRLLGWVPESRSRFQHHRANPLPHDVVVVDEASMVNVTLMARLLAALRPQARLVLIGDPDQLAPVEAGPVLADIVAAPAPAAAEVQEALRAVGLPEASTVVRLMHNYRSVQAIAQLAAAVLAGDPDETLRLATSGTAGVRFAEHVEDTDLRAVITRSGTAMVAAARAGRVEEALTNLEHHRLLCAHRRGPFGVALWSRLVEEWLGAAIEGFDPGQQWYPGRPLLVTGNSPDLGLYNGDTGVVVRTEGDQLRAFFARGTQLHSVSPFLLEGVQTIHAMTVHKAQGGQFEEVTVVLPPPDSPLLTQELLYTAITRAKAQVTLIGSVDSLQRAVRQRARRASGLQRRL